MSTLTPSPLLDTGNGDLTTAEVIGSLPAELSDRSDSNPAVVMAEALGLFYDKLIYQLNQWPLSVVQYVLNLIGVPLNSPQAAITTQQFTLSSPQTSDTVITEGNIVGTQDGSITFATLEDLVIPAYLPSVGIMSTTIGSTAVVGVGFVSGATWVGWQIQIQGGPWYTIQSVSSTTNLVLTSNASSTVTAGVFNVGPVSGTIAAQATTQAAATNIGANKLTVLQGAPGGVATTTNITAASGGADLETVPSAIARAPQVFASRDLVITTEDYAHAAIAILGLNSRAKANGNMNGVTSQSGYTSIALLSPAWSVNSSVSTQERGNVIRDLAQRTLGGITNVDLAANIQRFDQGSSIPAVCIWRQDNYDPATVSANIGAALNTYLSPNTYQWGRTIYTDDLVKIVANVQGVDRVENRNGVPCVGIGFNTTIGSISFTNASQTATASNSLDVSSFAIGRTFLIDTANMQAYLVIGISSLTLTLDRHYVSATNTITGINYMTGGDTVLSNWYSLPYSALSVDSTAPAASIVILGSV